MTDNPLGEILAGAGLKQLDDVESVSWSLADDWVPPIPVAVSYMSLLESAFNEGQGEAPFEEQIVAAIRKHHPVLAEKYDWMFIKPPRGEDLNIFKEEHRYGESPSIIVEKLSFGAVSSPIERLVSFSLACPSCDTGTIEGTFHGSQTELNGVMCGNEDCDASFTFQIADHSDETISIS